MPLLQELSPKQTRFCLEYVATNSGTKAALLAGYSPKTAHSIASENLHKPEIQAEIARLRHLEQTATLANPGSIPSKLRRLAEIYSMSPGTPVSPAHIVSAMAEHSKLAGHYPAEKHQVAARVVIEVVMVDKTVHTNIITQGAPVIEGEARMIPEPPQPPV